jgi:hypothetical protein
MLSCRLSKGAAALDISAATPGSYWPDFADEVDGQLYGLEEILEWYLRKR